MSKALNLLSTAIIILIITIGGVGCANIVPPGGGPRDSLPPVLVTATPADSAKNIRPSKIALTFNEYVEIQNTSENVIISPTVSDVPPTIDSRLKTITIRLPDGLDSNTTYSINFGNSIKDVNEGNVMKNFTYVFSTGNKIDQNTFRGKVVLAETGKIDSSLIVVLHRNLSDSAVIKERPRYYTKLDGSGSFSFQNLPAGNFAVYVLPNDYSKRYDDSTKMFAFLNQPVTVSSATPDVKLYAYEQAKRKPTVPTTSTGTNTKGDKRLRYTNQEGFIKDILTPLQLDFNRKLKTFDSSKIILADTNFNRLANYTVNLDSTQTKLIIRHNWKPDDRYKLILPKDALADAEGISLLKNDTIAFITKKESDYGSVKLRFINIDLSKNPVLQIVQNEMIIESIPLTAREWQRKLYKPGEYDLRILYDSNKNGIWDPGNFSKKFQPEIVQSISRKLTIKGNWENEVDISL
jgi:hypothetical protein